MFPKDTPREFDEYNAAKIPEGFDVRSGKHGHHWAQYSSPIEKSENDPREYKLIRLDNGLEALLVSDDAADRCAATLSVRVGYMHDPPELPGLAHFCEHLLFCGSQRWPAENEYSAYLKKHGGDCNASTTAEYTTYDLTIMEAAKLGGALDRMAALFTAPLFEASVVEREIKAINSEFERHRQSDSWRFDQIQASLSKKGHPWAKFGCGNLKTLLQDPKAKGINLRKELIKFHAENYSANLMRLCVVSSHSLETLTEMVAGTFSDVPMQNKPPTVWPGHPMSDKQLGQQLYVQRIKNGELLHIEFPLEDQTPYYETAPAEFLANLIGHESSGSLLSYLKSKSWASSLVAGTACSATGWSSFAIDIDMTETGKKCQNDIVLALFSYLRMLKAEGPSERIFREYAQLDNVHWRFEEKGDPDDLASWAVQNMHEPYPRSRILSQAHRTNKFDADLISKTLACLNPNNMALAYCSPDEAEGIEYDRTEEYFGAKYAIVEISDVFLHNCRHAPITSALHTPLANPYIPIGVHKVAPEDVQKPWTKDSSPIVLKDEPGLRIWYQQDATFLNPKTTVQLACRSELAWKSARNLVMQALFTDILEENMNEISYQAMEAGMDFSFGVDARGFSFSFSGYTQQLPKLGRQIFEHLANIDVTPEVFGRLREELERMQKNWKKSNAMAKASFLLNRVAKEVSYTAEEKLRELQTLTGREVIEFGRSMLREMFVEAYFHGSIGTSGALHFMEEFTNFLPYQPIDNFDEPSCYLLKCKTDSIIHGYAENPEEVDGALINAYCVGYSHDRDTIMRCALVQSILEEKAFDELRTKQQLGYMVMLGQSTVGRVSTLTMRIESELPPWEVDDAVEEFFEDNDLTFVNMSDEDLEDYKTALANALLEAFTCMDDQIGYNWKGIDDGQLGFKLYKHDAERVMNITKQDLVDFYRDYVLRRGHKRAKLSVQVMSQRAQPDNLQDKVDKMMEPYPVGVFTELQECIDSKPTLAQLCKALPKFVVEAEKGTIASFYEPDLPEDSSIVIIRDYKEFQAGLEKPPGACAYENAD